MEKNEPISKIKSTQTITLETSRAQPSEPLTVSDGEGEGGGGEEIQVMMSSLIERDIPR